MTKWEDKKDFKSSVLTWAEKLEIEVHSVYLRPMKNKWASCSTNGHLNFNDELLNIERILGEYVIVHELMHFRTPNHGSLWKSFMNAYMPDWELLDNKLKEVTLQSMKNPATSCRTSKQFHRHSRSSGNPERRQRSGFPLSWE